MYKFNLFIQRFNYFAYYYYFYLYFFHSFNSTSKYYNVKCLEEL